MELLRDFLERFGFEVCSRIGQLVGIPADRIRMYFIYTSFLTFGSPILVYLILAFFKKIRFYLRAGRRMSWFEV